MEEDFFDDLFEDTPLQLLDLLSTPSRPYPGHGLFNPTNGLPIPHICPNRLARNPPTRPSGPLTATNPLARVASSFSTTPGPSTSFGNPGSALSYSPLASVDCDPTLPSIRPTETPRFSVARQANGNLSSAPPTHRALPPPILRHLDEHPSSDDFYLNQLARDFSSPSLPAQSPRRSAPNNNSIANPPNLPPLSRNPAPASLSGADLLRRADQLVAGPFNLQAVKNEPAPDVNERRGHQDLRRPGSFTTSANMPPGTRSRTRAGTSSDFDSDIAEIPSPVAHRTPRRAALRANTMNTMLQQPRAVTVDSDSLFGSPRPTTPQQNQDPSTKKRKRDPFDTGNFDDDNIPVVDLADCDQVPESMLEIKKPKNEVKLSAFQCVICMDDVTDLTVTHCGHLFCSECLHSSLHIDVTKKVCPICRQKIELRPASGKFSQKQKGFYNLELKLMTKKTLRNRTAQS